MFKVATWNVNSIAVRLPHLLQWMETASPDVLAIQETKSIDEKFPFEAFKNLGYHVVFSGQKTYNGTAIIAKNPITDVLTDIPGLVDDQRRILAATVNGVRILDLYVPNGQSVGSEKYQYKLNWLEKVTEFIQTELTTQPFFVTLGDFNIAPEEIDVHEPMAWEGHVLFSEPERAAFKKLLATGLHDSFRLFPQAEKQFSWWDYRQLAFRRNHGLRIDHILVNDNMRKHCVNCMIDKVPRKWERPSDHAPVMAEFDLP